jgi:hypothetical protein
MIDPPAQHGIICFAGCDDENNFRYCDRDSGTVLANGLNHAFGLGSFGGRLGMICVIGVALTMTVGVLNIFKKMVNAMGLRNRECKSE